MYESWARAGPLPRVSSPLPANGRRYLVWLDEAVEGGCDGIKH